MKSLKIVLASLLLTVTVIGFSSFMSKGFDKKAFDRVCFYLTPGGVDKTDPDSWTAIDEGDIITLGICPGGSFLCAICFDDAEFPIPANGKPSVPLLNQVAARTLSSTANNPETHTETTVEASPKTGDVDYYKRTIQ